MLENSTVSVLSETYKQSGSNIREYTGAYLVSFSVLSERFSFWGLQAVMVLFLIQFLSQDEKSAFTLLGAFGALNYAFSLLGGLLADKSLGVWKSCQLGLALCLAGNLILGFSCELINLNVGLSCILVGAGLFSPSSNSLVRMLYEKKPNLKESGFLITCVAGNISGALAPLIYGVLGGKGLWHYAFFVSAILNFFALLCFFRYSNYFFRMCGNQLYHARQRQLIGQVLVISFIVISFGLLTYIKWLNILLMAGMGLLCFLIGGIYYQLNLHERQRMKFVFFLTCILLLFYIAVFQIYSSLTLFIDHYVNRKVMEWEVPAPAFASLQCIFFILCAPIVEKLLFFLRKKGYSFSLLIKIPLGLAIGAMGFLFFGWAEWIVFQSGSCGIGRIVFGNFLLGLSEVFLYPPILMVVSSFSPRRWTGTFIGIFSISLALSSYFSGQVAKLIIQGWTINIQHETSVFYLRYARISLLLLGVSILSGMIFLCLSQWYRMQEKLGPI